MVCNKVREGDKRIVRLKEGNPAGCHVVIVDDLVQSGGTLIECQVSSNILTFFLFELFCLLKSCASEVMFIKILSLSLHYSSNTMSFTLNIKIFCDVPNLNFLFTMCSPCNSKFVGG